MFITEQNIVNYLENIVVNPEQVRIIPAPAPELTRRFNAERTGWIETIFMPVQGIPLNIELHVDHIEAWTLNHHDNVIVEYSELSDETITFVRKIFGMLTADEKQDLGFDQIEA